MEPLIEYFFGTGDGVTTTWSSTADVDVDMDGTLDAVRLDFDGDGSRDDAMWDSDGDGIADAAILDIDAPHGGDAASGDAEGRSGPRIYRDTGRGVWDERVWDAMESGRLPGDSGSAEAAEERGGAHDLDGDGRPDVHLRSTPQGLELFVDSDGDGAYDRILVDSDGDGRADTTREAPPPD